MVKWILVNINADGYVSTDFPNAIVLTGGDNGSGKPGFTNYITTADQYALVRFHWEYYTADNLAEYDPLNFLVAGNPITIFNGSSISSSGDYQIAVIGDYGFQIATTDNQFGAATGLISDFTFTVIQVPFTGNFLICLVLFLTLTLFRARFGRKKMGPG